MRRRVPVRIVLPQRRMANAEINDTTDSSAVDAVMRLGTAPPAADGADAATMTFEFARLDDVCMHEVEIERKFLGELLALVPQTIARISSLIAAGDAAAVEASAHALKGHCLMLGANALGRVFAELENDAQRGRLGRGRALISHAELELIRLRTLIEGYLDSVASAPTAS